MAPTWYNSYLANYQGKAPEEPAAEFVEFVMQDAGVKRGEAIRRLALEPVIARWVARMREANPETFAGAWLDSTPDRYGVVIAFAGDAPAVPPGLEQAFGIEVRQFRRSEAELRDATRRVVEIRQAGPAEAWNQFTIAIEVKTNQVVIWSAEPETTAARLAPFLVGELGEMVRVLPTPVFSGDDACARHDCAPDMMAGLDIGCAVGFIVRKQNSSETGFLTAGHCSQPTTYDSNPLGEVLGHQNGGDLDVKWVSLSPSIWKPSNKIWTSSSGRLNVEGTYPRNLIMINMSVAMSGAGSGKLRVGKVTHLDFHPKEKEFDTFSVMETAEARFGVKALTGAPPVPRLSWLLSNTNTNQCLTDATWEFGNAPTEYPVAGDWSGPFRNGDPNAPIIQDPRSQPGVFDGVVVDREGKPRLAMGLTGINQARAWDGDGNGIDEVAIFNSSTGLWTWEVPGQLPASGFFGDPGDQPVVGDWDGIGGDNFGVYRNNTFYLSTAWGTHVVGPFGNPGDGAIAGDWDGVGWDKVGVYRPSEGRFYLQVYSSTVSCYFGILGDRPVVGDWDGNGTDTVGVVRSI